MNASYAASVRLLALSAALALAACAKPVDSGWSGYAEGEYVYVAAPLAGRLSQLAVQRGREVEAGALLFSLDAESEIAARAEAAARLAGAQAQADNTGKGRRAHPTGHAADPHEVGHDEIASSFL